MAYHSPWYLFLFLPAVLLLYQAVPQRHRWKVLLLASYLFFYVFSGKLLVYLLVSTFSMHHIGLWLSSGKKDYLLQKKTAEDKSALKARYNKKRKGILWLGIGIQLGMLLFLKYFNFFGETVNALLNRVSSPVLVPVLPLALPLGISFYTLQALSYLIEVYYEKIEADDNLGRLALYLSFFPVLMEGPICRYSQIAGDLYEGASLRYQNLTFGAQRILWGLFKKIVIADRLYPLVKLVFGEHESYGGIVVIAAAVCYTFQLYMEFSGCIDITIGTGQIFGVSIPENFRQPFFSKTASEFWRRWHITLGTWFKDFIFYPISLTKFVKNLGKSSRKRFGKHLGQIIPSAVALFGVWICNGLWHGTGWNYIFYGMYYFVLILLGNALEPLAEKAAALLHRSRQGVFWRVLQTVKLLLIVFTGELFFRAEGLQAGMSMFRSVFTGFTWSAVTDGSLLALGLSLQDYIVAAVGLLLVLLVGILHERGISIREKLAARPLVFRWSCYYAAILLVVLFGAYGPGYAPIDLIYAGF